MANSPAYHMSAAAHRLEFRRVGFPLVAYPSTRHIALQCDIPDSLGLPYVDAQSNAPEAILDADAQIASSSRLGLIGRETESPSEWPIPRAVASGGMTSRRVGR
jgi:hypothetical protein